VFVNTVDYGFVSFGCSRHAPCRLLHGARSKKMVFCAATARPRLQKCETFVEIEPPRKFPETLANLSSKKGPPLSEARFH